jgi:hypothetical protein
MYIHHCSYSITIAHSSIGKVFNRFQCLRFVSFVPHRDMPKAVTVLIGGYQGGDFLILARYRLTSLLVFAPSAPIPRPPPQ